MKTPSLRTGHFYCRHDNRVVGSCPRMESIGQCPLRLDCPAFTGGCRTQLSSASAR